ncbi:hypothetical protein LINPERHAP2_LOCUS32397 [Linum perenne]
MTSYLACHPQSNPPNSQSCRKDGPTSGGSYRGPKLPFWSNKPNLLEPLDLI